MSSTSGQPMAAGVPVRFDRHTLVALMRNPDGPALTDDQAADLQDEHLDYLAGLVNGGQIVAVGPLTDADDEQFRGLSIWSVDQQTARRLIAEDPSVRAGRLTAQVSTWLVPAGMIGFEKVRVPQSRADV
jgi:uncharacterized protein YciI